MKEKLQSSVIDNIRKTIENLAILNFKNSLVFASASLENFEKAIFSNSDYAQIVDRESIFSSKPTHYHKSYRLPLKGTQTISLIEIIERCNCLNFQLKVYTSSHECFNKQINDITYHGFCFGVPIVTIFNEYIDTAKLMIESYGGVFDQETRKYYEIAKNLLNNYVEPEKKEAFLRIAKAIHEFNRRFGHLEHDSIEVRVKAIEDSYMLTQYSEELVKCPACGYNGVVTGLCDHELIQDNECSPSVIVTLFPEEFYCKVCNLTLENSEQLSAAEIEDSIEIENVDISDFFSEDVDL